MIDNSNRIKQHLYKHLIETVLIPQERTKKVSLELKGEERELVEFLYASVEKYLIEEVIYKYNYEGIGLGFTTYLSFVYLIKEIFGDDFFSSLLIKIANNSLTLALFLYLTIIGFGILLLPAYPNLKNQSISSLIYQIINWLFPNNLFLHGEEKIEYENLIQRRKNFFWGVIVGLLVSIIGGIVVLSIS